MLNNKSILITGGTGSFGKKFTKMILERYPDVKRLVIYSRDELKQFEMAQMYPTNKYPQVRFFIGDVRDGARFKRACEGIDVIIHAAALKHVPIAEYNPDECVKTNIGGAQNVIDGALASNVKIVVALSTDKAAAPINLYGATKLVSDKLFIAANNVKGFRDLRFSAVRYGNVMGSRGSVIPFFVNKAKNGGVLPITHKDMTRFNISLEEGVEMVLWAIENAIGGEIFVPKIPSYKIETVAKAIAPNAKLEYNGIRPGEKLHEEMITESDSYNTIEFDKYYAILPSDADKGKYLKRYNAWEVEKGFTYNSGTNEEWETVGTLQKKIVKYVDPNFKTSRMKPIPYGKQHITEEDIQAVVDVLKSDFLTQGPRIPEFEKAFAEYVGSKYAVAVANGTAALHLCTLALGVKEGDKIITTPITFAASANCVRYAGGDVIFVDIDPQTYLLDLNQVEQLLKKEKNVKGIIPVDFAGRAVDLESLRQLADKYHCWILEDACHAPGGYFIDSNGTKQFCGNGQYAELAIFSFHPVKHIAAGEGGMITTNDEKLYKKLLTLRTHGITKDSATFENSINIAYGDQLEAQKIATEGSPDTSGKLEAFPPWYYEMQQLGFNYRLTDLQAALGTSQLKKAAEGLKRRREIAQNYYQAFKEKPFIKGQSGVIEGHAYHLYIIETENRKGLYEYSRSHKIFAQIHYVPVHMMPYYNQFGWKVGNLPKAEKYYRSCLSLPMYPTLTDTEQIFVCETINNFFL